VQEFGGSNHEWWNWFDEAGKKLGRLGLFQTTNTLKGFLMDYDLYNFCLKMTLESS